jgi:inorganic pyrophosphatase
MNKITDTTSSPDEINVIIEISMDSDPIKYEVDKESGLIKVDRFMNVAMRYPCNYGYVPQTLGNDGDPLDALVICQYPVIPGCILKARPIGALMMEDESGIDEKIIALPTIKADPFFADIYDIDDLADLTKQKIKHFFQHYKDLEKNKWVKVQDWLSAAQAKELILKYSTIHV